MIAVRSGRVTVDSDVHPGTCLGSDDPESWLYRVTLNGPTILPNHHPVPAASVLHVRYMPRTPRAPGPAGVTGGSSPLTPPGPLVCWRPPRPEN